MINAHKGWDSFFYRTSNGAEIDLLLCSGKKKKVFEFKANGTPKPTRGFYSSIQDIQPDEAWVVGLVNEVYPLDETVNVAPLWYFL